eukprot:672892-Hanusia_phi.AAC.1
MDGPETPQMDGPPADTVLARTASVMRSSSGSLRPRLAESRSRRSSLEGLPAAQRMLLLRTLARLGGRRSPLPTASRPLRSRRDDPSNFRGDRLRLCP